MKHIYLIITLLLLGISGVQAQFEAQSPGNGAPFNKQPALFEKAFAPGPSLYGSNSADNANDHLFNGLFKTDPRLIMGIQVAPSWSLEAGYVNLFDRGFHRVDERDTRDTAGALGTNGFSTHAAVKYTLLMTDRLSAYGKLGIAYSEGDIAKKSERDIGLYTGVGAKLKVNDRMSISGEYGNHGSGVRSLGNSNSNTVKANVGISF